MDYRGNVELLYEELLAGGYHDTDQFSHCETADKWWLYTEALGLNGSRPKIVNHETFDAIDQPVLYSGSPEIEPYRAQFKYGLMKQVEQHKNGADGGYGYYFTYDPSLAEFYTRTEDDGNAGGVLQIKCDDKNFVKLSEMRALQIPAKNRLIRPRATFNQKEDVINQLIFKKDTGNLYLTMGAAIHGYDGIKYEGCSICVAVNRDHIVTAD